MTDKTDSLTPTTDREVYIVSKADIGFKVVNAALCRILEKALRDLVQQVDTFCEKQGEADFYTGRAHAALKGKEDESKTTG